MRTSPAPVGVIVGSAFQAEGIPGVEEVPVDVQTPFGTVQLMRVGTEERVAYVRYRHERPHRLLPNQIPYRAQAWAFREVGCEALLVTSSVGVLDPSVPLNRPLMIEDLLMPDNRLPDGSACTVFDTPSPQHGHLVLNEGLFSQALTRQVRAVAARTGVQVGPDVVFAYVGGPRTKTAAENRLWAQWGAQVNSMTVGPEVVLANELGIPCAGLVVGHKYSVPTVENPDERSVAASLDESREAMVTLVRAFIQHGRPVAWGNHLFQFDAAPSNSQASRDDEG